MEKNIYVFGNQDLKFDNIAIKISKKLTDGNYIYINPNQDFEPIDKNIIIIDSAINIKNIKLLDDISKIKVNLKSSLHDYDISFQLKLMQKLGKINSIKIIAIPYDYNLQKGILEVQKIIDNI